MAYFSARPPERHNRLRIRDQYVEDTLEEFPEPPRNVTKPWLPARNWDYLLWLGIFILVMALLAYSFPYIHSAVRDGILLRSRYGILLLLSIPAIPWWISTLVTPLYRWQKGIREGRAAVATVIFVKPGRTSMAVRGTWEIRFASTTFTANFLEQSHEANTWVQQLREGDRIRVLLHPTKNKVLLAYGP